MARLAGWQPSWDREAHRVRFAPIYRHEGPEQSLYPEHEAERLRVQEEVIVTKYRRDTSHLFHLVMTLLTGGLWIFVWAAVAGRNKVGPRRKAVTRTRQVIRGTS